MASVNKVIVLGNLGKDPELRYTPNGMAVCNVSIATTRNWKSREGGERQEETEWHRVVFYDRLAEIVGEYLKKGRPVYVEGRLKTRKYEKEGQDHYVTEIVAESMQMLGSRDDGDGGQREQRGGNYTRERPAQQQRGERDRSGQGNRGGGQQQQRSGAAPPSGFDDMDDDIPFAMHASDVSPGTGKDKRLNRADY